MPDEIQTPTPAAPEAPSETPVVPIGGQRSAVRAAGREAFLAAVEKAPERAAEKPAPAEVAEEPAEEDAEAPEVEPETEEEDTEPEPQAAKDPDRDKRIEAVQKAEKRSLEKVAAERRKFDEERQSFISERQKFEKEWGPRMEAAQRFDEMKERAQWDLAGVAEMLGISAEDYEHHAKQLFRLSPRGKADPKNRDAYERDNREREHRQKLTAAEKRIQDMESKLDERFKALEEKERLSGLTQKAQKALGDDTPIMRKRFETHPEAAQKDFAIAVKYLREQTGEEPDPADVIRELEAIEQENARARGFTIPTKAPVKAEATPKTKTSPAGETKSAPPTSKEPAQPRGLRATREEGRRAFLGKGG